MPLKTAPLLLAAALALAACAASPDANTAHTAHAMTAAEPQPVRHTEPPSHLSSGQPARNQCNARAAQSLIGQPFDGGTLARALAAAGADQARLLREDSFITKEYQAGRVNVTTDAAGRVARVHCG